jgi:PqqD family protein of HPr-rel-A system
VPAAPKVRSDLTVVELDGEAVVYDERSGDLHHLNPTAMVVFSQLDGTVSVRELAGEIAEVLGTSPEEIERQVVGVVSDFGEAGLLEPVRPAG